MKRLFLLVILCFSAFLLHCFFSSNVLAASAKDAYDKAQTCREELKADPQKTKDTKNWDKCILSFKSVAQQFPKDSKAAEAIYAAARLNRDLYGQTKKTSYIEEAIHLYNSVVKDYPSSSLADDALYQIGILRHNPLKDDERAKKAFEAVISKYPNGDMAAKAKTSLEGLGEKGSVEETDVSEPVVAPPAKTKKEEKVVSETDEHFQLSNLIRVDVDAQKEVTIVTLELDRQTPFTRNFAQFGKRTKSPARLTLEFPRTRKGEDVAKVQSVFSPYINSISIKEGVFSGAVMIRFDLSESADYDIVQKREKTIIRFFGRGEKPATPQKTNTETQSVKETSKRPLRIVIDPGHGGKDTGAIGPSGIKEKTVTLAVSKKLVQILKTKFDAQVFLTRTEDKTMPLEMRNAFANKKKADLFISIHANANKDRKVSGIETYYLNNATDEAAKRLAVRENKSAAKPQNEVDSILLTLFQNYNTEESRLFAQDVHKTMMSRLSRNYKDIKDHKVRSALFYVLVGAKCPGILVETSFISNPVEEKRLVNSTYETHVAEAIADGVDQFIKSNKSSLASL